MTMTSKLCVDCKSIKHKSEFYKQKQSPDGLKNNCKACYKIKEDKRNEQHLIKRYVYFLKTHGFSVYDKNNMKVSV